MCTIVYIMIHTLLYYIINYIMRYCEIESTPDGEYQSFSYLEGCLQPPDEYYRRPKIF